MSEVQLSGDAVDGLNKILSHSDTVGGVITVSSMGTGVWLAAYTHGGPGGAAVAIHDELDEVIIGVAKQAGLI